MAEYSIEMAPAAERQFKKLDRSVGSRIAEKIDSLRANPRPHGVEKLAGAESLYRVRVGDYRIIYTINDERLIVLVVRIAHRREVYR